MIKKRRGGEGFNGRAEWPAPGPVAVPKNRPDGASGARAGDAFTRAYARTVFARDLHRERALFPRPAAAA